jgi:hypothetical protein
MAGGLRARRGAFAWMLVAVASRQYNAPQSLMTVNYWKESFPPAALWKAPLWLADIHAGNMMAYPVGGRHWGSIGTLLLCGIGAAVSAKKWPRPLLVLFATPFVLTLIAAAMHRYPYGGSARIAQHLAPAICLWAGLGAAWLLERQRDENKRRLAVAAVFSLLAIVGVVGIARDFLHPAKTPGDARARERVREWTAAPGGCVLAVWEPMETVPVNFQWYLRQGGSAIVWNARADESWAAARGPVSVLNFDPNAQLAKRLPAKLPGFRVTDSSREEILVGPPELGPAHWESVRLEPPQPAKLKVP